MGCWNGTCAITNLPIYAGEKVYVFFLKEGAFYDKYTGNHCDPDNYYMLEPLYFEGEYNDYGSVESITGDFADLILKNICDNLFEMEKGENQYHDVEVKKEGMSLEKLLDIDHEKRLFVLPDAFDRSHGVVSQRLTHITIRKGVLDRILASYKFETYVMVDDEYKDVAMSFSDMVEEIEVVRTHLQGYLGDNPMYRDFFDVIPMRSVTSGVWEPLFGYVKRKYNKTLFPLLLQTLEDPEKFKSVMVQVLTYVWLERLYDDGRNMWIKPSGCGSQNTRTVAQQVIAQAVMGGVQDMKQYRIDNEWDMDDE